MRDGARTTSLKGIRSPKPVSMTARRVCRSVSKWQRRSWKVMEGHGRSWKVMEGGGRSHLPIGLQVAACLGRVKRSNGGTRGIGHAVDDTALMVAAHLEEGEHLDDAPGRVTQGR